MQPHTLQSMIYCVLTPFYLLLFGCDFSFNKDSCAFPIHSQCSRKKVWLFPKGRNGLGKNHCYIMAPLCIYNRLHSSGKSILEGFCGNLSWKDSWCCADSGRWFPLGICQTQTLPIYELLPYSDSVTALYPSFYSVIFSFSRINVGLIILFSGG